ncbi:Tvp38 protein [Saccharomycopsis crataegensis]|uniref:Golgi apparatus membrane protein TVP38 n=1 Tax=Saccharomycopsis crataegensis TaxID=43959 RepID=A0AAV5QHT0_9ASCO|nr:Tvp38 protein [Saccharomycopsis crataegensis]
MERSRLRRLRENIIAGLRKASRYGTHWYSRQSLATKIAAMMMVMVVSIMAIVIIANYETFMAMLVTLSKEIRESKYGEFIIFGLIIVCSFPPIIGLSTLCSITGMAYGMSFKGWFIVASGTAVGSTLSFLLFKYLLSKRAQKFLDSSKLFLAFATVLGQDKDKFLILCLLQLCPRPYSITNAAFAAIPQLDALSFLLSGLIASPKYLIMIFVGYKMEHIGQNKDFKTRLIDFIIIFLTNTIAFATSWLIYKKTREKLAALGGDISDEDDEDGLPLVSSLNTNGEYEEFEV